MRTPFVAGNWKMNMSIADARQFVAELTPKLETIEGVEVAVCPPFTSLMAIAALLQGSSIGLGAQNMHWETKGAFTGEIAPGMVAELCQYVILGHSERRAYFGETDEIVNHKVKAGLAHGLKPIVCVGETLQEREQGITEAVVARQIDAVISLSGIDSFARAIIAYEPVWAIGTGKVATPDQAQAVHAFIRDKLAQQNAGVAEQVKILYGGSMNPSNAAELLSQSDIDGGLIGGASLKADDFLANRWWVLAEKFSLKGE